ncbi:MAG: hypothetical protein Q4E73_01585 [Lachnospiraceae bacterium]|nr:hypothetical protein [Lachnospiraceae bacterium]
MEFNQSEQIKGVSICFCILHYSKEEEALLLEMQRRMSESGMKIRQCYVYGDQTVNATEFFQFLPDHYTKPESSKCGYPAHEALILAAGMMQKEEARLVREGMDEDFKCLLLIIGEKAALKQQINRGSAYQTVRQWAIEQKEFKMEIIDEIHLL